MGIENLAMPDLPTIAGAFAIEGVYVDAEPHGSGHINDTFRLTFAQAGRLVPVLLQRINHHIFKDPRAVMDNISRVTAHLRPKAGADERRTPTLIPTRTGANLHCDEAGHWWRMYHFINGARSYDAVQSTGQAYQAAKAFGRFQGLLADLPAPRLHDTIPDFHHTPKRFAALETAIAADPRNRAAMARPEIDFAVRRKVMTGVLLDAGLPERVTHNDTKLNNVLLDDATGKGVCVIDLDTVMPGLALYDFGDLVRTTTSPTLEDERDLSQVGLRLPMFEALLRGYLDATSDFLTPAERRHLVVSGKLIAFEMGLRFLTDYLQGDTYYRTHREAQNLDRCRTQFRLVESIESQEDAMQRLVDSLESPLSAPRHSRRVAEGRLLPHRYSQ